MRLVKAAIVSSHAKFYGLSTDLVLFELNIELFLKPWYQQQIDYSFCDVDASSDRSYSSFDF